MSQSNENQEINEVKETVQLATKQEKILHNYIGSFKNSICEYLDYMEGKYLKTAAPLENLYNDKPEFLQKINKVVKYNVDGIDDEYNINYSENDELSSDESEDEVMTEK